MRISRNDFPQKYFRRSPLSIASRAAFENNISLAYKRVRTLCPIGAMLAFAKSP